MLNVGEINKLIVKRKTDIGYMLENDANEEVFLHNNETNHKSLSDGTLVDAYLYFDNKGRLAATLSTPIITVSNPGFLTVRDVNSNLGIFLDNGISKDVLLSKDDLPEILPLWPKPGDKLYVYLKVKGNIVAKPAPKNEVKLLTEDKLLLNHKYTAYVLRVTKEGLNLVTDLGHIIFVYKSYIRRPYRLGEEVEVKIVNISEIGYNGSLIENKEEQLHEDANLILAYLTKNNGEMPLTSDSSSEEINEVFKISKKAFKRGLGNLYRQRIVDFVDNKTILMKKEK